LKPTKEETIILISKLQEKGLTHTEIAAKMSLSSQTVWAWSSLKTTRIPSLIDYQFMLKMLD
jgi:orotate phosphoribosyltransferase-like protein